MKTRTILLLTLWFIIIIIAMVGLFYLTFFTDSTWYIQIDNTRLTDVTPRGGMYYRYELTAWNESGRERKLTFETSRILRDGAYLRLNVAPLRGVTDWTEIQPDDVPAAAWEAFSAAE